MPETVTAAVVPDEDMVTSLLTVYSESMLNSCGTEVDWSIVPADAIIGVNISRAGNIFPRVIVVLFNTKYLLLMCTSI
ncbi:hypothetical protein [Enterobacter cancerogenus]|uniref:hypothetical protein n=1 Tax=Enterobacter cancerogenus TaxID=69218 RepID=UPI001D0E6B44|nr:hypothetical protein [Enterobacter cancerogenus]